MAVEAQTILSVDVIRTDGGTQPRAEVDQEVIRDYAQQMFEGVQFPPVTVYYDGTDYWLADGFHRYYATKQQCRDVINVEIKQGTRRDAVLFSVGANATHGLRRTNADKRRAVETLLNDPEWGKWSNREIARRCAVDEITVRRTKETLSATMSQMPAERYVERNGTIYTMNTANIGQQLPQPTPAPSIFEPEPYIEEDEPDTEPSIPTYTPPRYEPPVYAPTYYNPPTYVPAPTPTPAPIPPVIHPEMKSAVEQAAAILEQRRVEDLELKRRLKEQERELKRDTNRQMIAQAKSIDEILGTAKFSTIVIDPPWDWGDEGDVDQFGRGRPVYGTMSMQELLDLPVGKFADENSHIYLWITNRSLPKGFALLEAWGFRYVTCITWVKPYFGMGNYFRGQTEHMLFGVKGSQMLKRRNAGTILRLGEEFAVQRGPNGHSSKPLEAYPFIESCSPGPYLEIFARSERDDWTSWGAEV